MPKMTVLLTGFEPFNQSPINPSAEVVAALSGQLLPDIELHTCVLPVVSKTAPVRLYEQLDAIRPDLLISLGEARGRSAINVECLAANELTFRIPDNSGETFTGAPIVEAGPATYHSTFPAEAIRDAIRESGIPAVCSDNAGRYLCNQLLYMGLHWAATHRPQTQVGFIHLPSLPQQMAHSAEPKATMALSLQVAAIQTTLRAAVQVRHPELVS